MSQPWKKSKTICWSDELNDDFNKLEHVQDNPELKKNYKYIHKNPLRRFWDAFLYYLVGKPIMGIYCFFHGVRYKNKKYLKRLHGKGAFIYSNHTAICDVFKFQSMIFHVKRVNIVGFSNASSIPVASFLVKSFGYLPIGNDPDNLIRLKEACEFLVKKRKQHVLIYPEAHIWPYYTKIRDFKNVSFYYPAQSMCPVVPAVTVWRKVWYSKVPRQTVVFGKPIYPDPSLNTIENRDLLADECKQQMKHIASSFPQVEYIKYIKVEPKQEDK